VKSIIRLKDLLDRTQTGSVMDILINATHDDGLWSLMRRKEDTSLSLTSSKSITGMEYSSVNFKVPIKCSGWHLKRTHFSKIILHA
jgi:hypothetical protein